MCSADLAKDAPASAGVARRGWRQQRSRRRAATSGVEAIPVRPRLHRRARPIDTHTPIQSSPDGSEHPVSNFDSYKRPWSVAASPVPGVSRAQRGGSTCRARRASFFYVGEQQFHAVQFGSARRRGLPDVGVSSDGGTILARDRRFHHDRHERQSRDHQRYRSPVRLQVPVRETVDRPGSASASTALSFGPGWDVPSPRTCRIHLLTLGQFCCANA